MPVDPDPKLPWDRDGSVIMVSASDTAPLADAQSSASLALNRDDHAANPYTVPSGASLAVSFPTLMDLTGMHVHSSTVFTYNIFATTAAVVPGTLPTAYPWTTVLGAQNSLANPPATTYTHNTTLPHDAWYRSIRIVPTSTANLTCFWFWGAPAMPTGLSLVRWDGYRPNGNDLTFGTVTGGTTKLLRFRVINNSQSIARDTMVVLYSFPDKSAQHANGFKISIEGLPGQNPPVNIGSIYPGPDPRVLHVRASNIGVPTQGTYRVQLGVQATSWDQ